MIMIDRSRINTASDACFTTEEKALLRQAEQRAIYSWDNRHGWVLRGL